MKRDTEQSSTGKAASLHDGEQGYMLLGLIVVIAIILIGLGVAASEVAFSLRREREVESARRADQYVRAIRRFYIKNQHYPGSIEQLENTNNVRYLRQKYVDPLTGKADYRLIPVGQNKTTVKGFFGQPLAGLATTGLGSVAGMQSPGIPGPGTAGPGGPGMGSGRGMGPGALRARPMAIRAQRRAARTGRRRRGGLPGRRALRPRPGRSGPGRAFRAARWGRLWAWAATRLATRFWW